MTRPQKLFLTLFFLIIGLSFINKGLLSLLFLHLVFMFWDIIGLLTGPTSQIFFPLKMKKIWTEFGKFYIYSKRDSKETIIYLFEDKVFFLKCHGATRYNNLEVLKKWSKSKVEEIYKDKILKSRVDDELESWDVTYDKESSRDKK